MTVTEEIDSFVKKFLCLSSKGNQAKLFLETEAGKVSINLCANLGQVPSPPGPVHDVGRRVGGSRLRRRERRAASRQQAAEQVENAEEAGKIELEENAEQVEKAKEVAKAAEMAVIAKESNQMTIEETPKAAEEANKSMDGDTIAEKASSSNELEVNESDCDLYIFTYWDNQKASKAQEALDYIEKTLKHNFKKLKVKDSDQIYKVDEIEHLEENEIQVKVKLKKNNWSVERAARNVQTAYLPENPVSIKNILR